MSGSRYELETVRGQVAGVRVLKDGWGKLRLTAGSGESAIDVTGQVLGLDIGTTVECKGRWDIHPSYGKQFKATTISTVIPSDASGVIAWISSRLPAVGRKRAAELVALYGVTGLWDVLERTPERLAEDVRGITPALAESIAAEYARVRGEREEMVTLRGWGLSESQIKRCREVWKNEIVRELQRNPYQLCELVYGFGFDRADVVARKMGISREHPGRIQACLLHQLSEAEGAGHCYVPTGKLVALAADALGLTEGQVRAQLDDVCDDKRAVRCDAGAKVYRASTYVAELAVVVGVRALLEGHAANGAHELEHAIDDAAEAIATDAAAYLIDGDEGAEARALETAGRIDRALEWDDAPWPDDDDAPPSARKGASDAAA